MIRSRRNIQKEIISSRFFEGDYRAVTQRLLYENITYDYAIEHGIAIVAESKVFEYKRDVVSNTKGVKQ